MRLDWGIMFRECSALRVEKAGHEIHYGCKH